MAGVQPTSTGEASTPSGTFSYAQAAKGRSTSVPSGPQTPSELSLKESNPTTVAEGDASTKDDGSSLPRDAELNNLKDSQGAGAGHDSTNTAPVTQTPPRPTPMSPQPQQQSRSSLSVPQSPVLPAISSPVAYKEDDHTPARITSPESAWERQSQVSSGADRTSEVGSVDKSSQRSNGDVKERPTALVAAPVPTVNIWQQRREAQAQAAKAKAAVQRPSPVQHTSEQSTRGRGGSTAAASAPTNDPTVNTKTAYSSKGDSKKKTKTAYNGAEAPDRGATRSQSPSGGRDKFRSGANARFRDETVKKPLARQRSLPDREKEPGPAPQMVPLPVEDPTSWPTPDLARGEEKKKAQEKTERGDKDRNQGTNAKAHGKEKWTHVPYTPTVVFETQISPRRGGRFGRGGREGGRGGHIPNGSISAEKSLGGLGIVSSTGPMDGDSNNRGRVDPATLNSGSPPGRTVKRAVSAGPQAGREQRKAMPAGAGDRRREQVTGARNTEARQSGISRRTSTATQMESPPRTRHDSRQHSRVETGQAQNAEASGFHIPNMAADEAHAAAVALAQERRGEGYGRPGDHFRDGEGYRYHRERGEHRSERSRGGYRGGRGGNNGYGSLYGHPSAFPNGNYPNSSSSTGGKGPYNHHHHQHHGRPSQGGQYNSGSSHSRSGRRQSHSPSRTTPLGRYAGVPENPAHIAAIQTQMGPMYEYQALQAMSAIPYNPFVEQYSVLGMVSMQLEYYFSVDNLCKDLFLRKQMDSQGFVLLTVIANFNRIRQLTQDMELVRYACYQSRTIELYQAPDGLDRVRRREGWKPWVLGLEERDPSAQTEGPAHSPPAVTDDSQSQNVSQVEPYSHNSPSIMPGYLNHHGSDPFYGSSNAMPHPFIPASQAPLQNGTTNGDTPVSKASLSATVPDFSPIVSSTDRQEMTQTGDIHVEDAFPDQEIDNLFIVIRDRGSPVSESTFPPSVTRTFSNGSLDGKTLTDALSSELLQTGLRPNGQNEKRDIRLSVDGRSPPPTVSPSKTSNANPPPVFWVKDRDIPMASLPAGLSHESYNTFRENALHQRGVSPAGNCHHDMEVLYQFWSHFLVRNFNTRMYGEFHSLALDDQSRRNSNLGLKNLVQYYDAAINGQKVVSDVIAKDYVALVQTENAETGQLGFPKLRSAWRNGALNMKNRKKIATYLSEELKAKLER